MNRIFLIFLCICTITIFNLPNTSFISTTSFKVQSKSFTSDIQVHDPIHITDDEDLMTKAQSENWDLNGTRDGSSNKPFVISNLTISLVDTKLIWIEGTSLHITIEKNKLSGGGSGIALWNSDNIIISMNHIFDNSYSGIDLQGTNTTISNNVIEGNSVGIGMFGRGNALIAENEIVRNSWKGIGIEDFEQVKIIKNQIYENGEGLEFLMYTRSTVVHDNNIHDNTQCGIFLGDNFLVNITNNRIHHNARNGIQYEFAFGNSNISDNQIFDNGISGIEIIWASNFQIESNEIFNHSQHGVAVLEDCHNLTIRWNNISHSVNYGLTFTTSTSDNIITSNNFVNNSILQTSQAYDSGARNRFIKNYWNDWASPDNDSNNFVDIPYKIDGDSGSNDLFPLSNPFPYIQPSNSTQNNSTTLEVANETYELITKGFLLPNFFLIVFIIYISRKKIT